MKRRPGSVTLAHSPYPMRLPHALFALLWAWSGSVAFGQSPDSVATVQLNPSRLSAHYIAIDFSEAQRDSIGDRSIEVILLVQSSGKAEFFDANNAPESWLLDSLRAATGRLPLFALPDSSAFRESDEYIYTLRFSYPIYRSLANPFYVGPGIYQAFRLEDFEYYEPSPERLDMLFGAVANQFIGSPARHLAFGGGMVMNVTYGDRKERAYGLYMNFYGNKLRRPYELVTSRELNEGPPTLAVGLQYGRFRGRWSLLGELGFAQHNVSKPLDANDTNWDNFQGASFGLVVGRDFPLGRGRVDNLYGSPVLIRGNVSARLGLRYNHYDHPEARGLMAELAVGYRIVTFGVERYKLKGEKSWE